MKTETKLHAACVTEMDFATESANKRRPVLRASLLEAHTDVALADITDVMMLTRMGRSWIHRAVRNGAFPMPVIRGPRCTRWRLADVRTWLIDRTTFSAGEGPTGEATRHLAKRASDAASTKRRALAQVAE